MSAQAYALSRVPLPRASTFPAQEGAGEALALETVELETAAGETFVAEYGHVEVPENRSDPNSRTIRVAFVRIRSGLEEPGAPLVYLAGGPGGPGIPPAERFVQGGGSRFFELVGGDVIGIDQRGVGRSEPNLDIEARYGFDPLAPATREARLERMCELARTEAKRWREAGVDLDGYDTAESADDVDAIRRALGYEKVKLWGGSYGSHLGVAVLRRHGAHVERAMFIGPEGPDHTVKLPSYADDGLERICRLAAKDDELTELMGDFLELVTETLGAFDEPRFVEVDGERVGISRLDVEEWLVNAIGYEADEVAKVPRTLHDLREGRLEEFATKLMEDRREARPWSAMSMAMDAASGMTEARRERIASEAKRAMLGDAATWSYAAVSAAWGVEDLGDAFRGPLETDVPVLFIVGDLDSRTPVANARELMRGMPNSHLLIVKNAGHGVPMGIPRLREAWGAFLRGEEVKTRRVTAPKIRFEVPGRPDVETPEPKVHTRPERAVDVSAEALEKCVGTYVFESGMVMNVSATESRLDVTVPGKGKFPLWPTSETEYFCTGAPIPDLTFEIEDGAKHATAVEGGGIRAERKDD